MAIEFDCPYCTATIRVPDAYGGQRGRCPKCDTHLLVPLVVRPGSPTVPDVAAAPLDDHAVPGSVSETNSQTEELFFSQVSPSKTTIRRRRTRRRTSLALVIGMPVLGVLVLMAIIANSVISALPLSGNFEAQRLAEKSLPRVTIPWSDTGLNPDDQKVLQEFLQTTPETLSSQIMTCRFIGAEEGIEVQLTAGPEHEWFAVSRPASSAPKLALWLKNEGATLNARRVSELRASLVQYCREKLAQIAGDPMAFDLNAVRDNVGFNAGSGPFSSVIQAQIGKQQLRCAYEDEQATIYFCLPKGTQSFQIVGRTLPDKSKPFTGEYSVTVAPRSASLPTTTAVDKTVEEPDTQKEDQSLPESDSTGDSGSTSEEMQPEMDGKMEMKPESDSMDSGPMKKSNAMKAE